MTRKPADGGQDDEYAWPLAPDPDQPPPGEYLVAYRRARLVRQRFGNRDTIELYFEVVDPPKWNERTLIMYCGIPLDGRPGKASKYVRAWTLANGGPAKRRDRMTPKVFAGYWVAAVAYTKRKMTNDGSKELDAGETGTAVISYLIERAAGGVPR